jgi:hypothetical protein
MRPILITVALALLLAAGAHAKGASEATIEGPGLDGRIVIPGDGEGGGGTPLGRIAQLAGFFPEVFGQTPDATSDKSPATSLGPRYVVRYVMPGPNGQSAVVTQDVYPYAKPAPVTYMKPLQYVWLGQRTVGGWYLTTTELKIALEGIGLPADAPVSGGSSDSPWTLVLEIGAGVLLAAGAIGATVAVRRRRRVHPAPSV